MLAAISFIIALTIYLFSFYYFAKDDLYFIRKGNTLDQLFNILFLGILFSLFSARLFYVLLNLEISLLIPLRFFLVPYYPGLSVLGAIVGLFVAYSFLTRHKKMPRLRFIDYTAVSLLISLPIFYIGVYFNYYSFLMYLILTFFFIFVLLPKYNKGLLKEGTLGYIFLIMVSVISFLYDIFLLYTQNILLHKESFLYVLMFLISGFLLVRLETKRIAKN